MRNLLKTSTALPLGTNRTLDEFMISWLMQPVSQLYPGSTIAVYHIFNIDALVQSWLSNLEGENLNCYLDWFKSEGRQKYDLPDFLFDLNIRPELPVVNNVYELLLSSSGGRLLLEWMNSPLIKGVEPTILSMFAYHFGRKLFPLIKLKNNFQQLLYARWFVEEAARIYNLPQGTFHCSKFQPCARPADCAWSGSRAAGVRSR